MPKALHNISSHLFVLVVLQQEDNFLLNTKLSELLCNQQTFDWCHHKSFQLTVRGCLHEAGLNSDRPDFSSDVVFFLYVVYMSPV